MQPGAPQPPQGYQPQGYPPQMPMAPAGPPNPAQTAGIIMMVCALAIAIGTFTKSWKSGGAGDEDGPGTLGVGLTGISAGPVAVSWGEMDDILEKSREIDKKYGGDSDDDEPEMAGVPLDLKLLGYLGFLGGIAAIGAAAGAGGLALSRKLEKTPWKPMLGILAGCAVLHVLFLIRLMTVKAIGEIPMKEIGLSYSGFVSILGLGGAAVVLASMLKPMILHAKANAPVYAAPMGQPMMGQPMMGQPMQPPTAQAAPAAVTCPRCQGQAGFVAQYNRYFCSACQLYV